MHIEIDQSGKIEKTSVPTVIAFSNHLSESVLIPANDKREIQNYFRAGGKPTLFVYKLFAVLIFILIKNYLKEIQHIVIDTEYPGWEHLIKDFLLREIRRVYPHFDPQNIAFTQIGKKSNAHSTGYRVYKKWQPPTRIIKASAVLKYLIK